MNEATVTDFSSVITRIPNDTQVVYIPWQLAAKAQQFGEQLRASGRNATLFGGTVSTPRTTSSCRGRT